MRGSVGLPLSGAMLTSRQGWVGPGRRHMHWSRHHRERPRFRRGLTPTRARSRPRVSIAESRPPPHGLSFTGNRNGTAIITGTPAPGSSGRYRVTITATNPSGKATRCLMIIIFRCRHR